MTSHLISSNMEDQHSSHVFSSSSTYVSNMACYRCSGQKESSQHYTSMSVTSMRSPITVLSMLHLLSSVYSIVMLPTLQHHMSLHNIPYEHQYGFTKLRSTYDAIARFLNSISKQYHMPVPAVFIDISKAYDRVWVHGLIHKLHQLNMSPHTLFFYRALLSHRSFRVSGNGLLSDLFFITDGVPQGGVSAPHLFTIYIHDLIAAIMSRLTLIHTELADVICINLFADDIVMWTSNIINLQPAQLFDVMQVALDALTMWASTWKITFSTSKTQMLIFYARKTLPSIYSTHHLILSGFTISVTDTYKYLGLIVHRQLSWIPHIRDLIAKCIPTSHQIARLAARKIHNRPPFRVIRQLIATVFIHKIAYALPFIILPPETDEISRQLKRLIIYPLRRALGLPNNAHHNSIFVESRLLPIRYLQQYHSILYARRYINQATTPADTNNRYN